MSEVRAMGTGHMPQADDPVWVLVREPTAAQVADAVDVAQHKVHSGVGTGAPYREGGMDFHGGFGTGWNWWLKMNGPAPWLTIYTSHIHADVFNPDEGRVISEGKHDYMLPGKWERLFMKAQGERALHKFIDGMDATNAERASQFAAIRDVLSAIEYGDLPAAIHAALSVALPGDGKDRLVELLEAEMIYWPDFQRTGSTSADRTIAHHIPAGPTNSGTSITISGSGTISGTSSDGERGVAMDSATGLPALDVVVIVGVAGFIAYVLRLWVKSILDSDRVDGGQPRGAGQANRRAQGSRAVRLRAVQEH